MTNLPQLRLDLAAAKAALRQAKDETEMAKAIATLDVTGRNDDERKRAAAAALLNNHTYKLALLYQRGCESEIDRIEAEIATHEDQIRADELRVREKLADALLRRREDNAIADILTIAKTALHTYQQHGDYQGNTPDMLRGIVQAIEKETVD